MVVRDWLGVGIPAAGVGCGFSREALARIAATRGRGAGPAPLDAAPFEAECLTEDYELGLLIAANGGTSRFLRLLLWLNLFSFVWRAGVRFGFTAHTYGWVEGLRALPRIPFANVIAIMAGRRALTAYLRSLSGGRVRWEKTPHSLHASELAMPLRAVEVAQ